MDQKKIDELIDEISVEGKEKKEKEEPKEEFRIYPKKHCKICVGAGMTRFYENVNPDKHKKPEFKEDIRPCPCLVNKLTRYYMENKEEMFPIQADDGSLCLSNIRSEIEEPENMEPINEPSDNEEDEGNTHLS